MEFGLFTEFHCPPGTSEAAAFEESMAQMLAAEALGFDAVWLAELHFQKDRSVLASPLAVAAAIAGRTRRVKIGIAVQVLPLSHPLRLAEDVATVDHLSKGRLEFGVGRSGLPGHYQGFNIPYAESRERFLETLDILVKAWTQERFSHDGTYFQFRDVCLVPKPYQKPHPPIRIAATTEETYALVGRRGFPVFVAPRTIALTDLERFIQGYRAGWAAAKRLGEISYDEVLAEHAIYGSPEAVVDRLLELREGFGFSSLSAWMNPGGQIPHERVLNSMRLFADQVIPRLG